MNRESSNSIRLFLRMFELHQSTPGNKHHTDRYLVRMLGPNSLSLCSPHLQWYRALIRTSHLKATWGQMKRLTKASFTEQTKKNERLTLTTL